MTDALRIAIVHYHLRPGGVTSVIRQAVSALENENCRIAVLAGSPAGPDMPGSAHYAVVDGLNYAATAQPPCSPDVLAERLEETARQALGGSPDIWHIHNHSLGKNCALPMAICLMAKQGKRILLQIHDFPEDGRPANYRALLKEVGGGDPLALGAQLYPQAGHVHYAALNERDAGFLCAAGCFHDRVHLLPNAVSMKPVCDDDTDDTVSAGRQTFLYPTRAIRRKNIGEFVLWSAAGAAGDRFAATLAPTSPSDVVYYKQWKEFAVSRGLPVEFEVGLKDNVPFQTLLKSAHAIVTTSVAEGFGLAFLEPWLAGQSLVGRDLPEMTQGFKREGINLSTLYQRLQVPLSWVGFEALRRNIESGWSNMMNAYGRALRPADVDSAIHAATDGDRVDFGRLDEDLQEQVIRRLLDAPSLVSELEPSSLLPEGPPGQLIEMNREIVQRKYNTEQYGRRLMDIYRSQMASAAVPVGAFRADTLLDKFLAPERFYLVRS